MVRQVNTAESAVGFDFSACLEQLESEQQEQRMEALQKLSSRPDSRSLTVLQALQEDENPEIRRQSIVLVRKMQQLGIRPRVSPVSVSSRERFTLSSSLQLIDEVCAIWSNRAWDYLISALVGGAPKLFLLVLIMYAESSRRGYVSALSLEPWLLFGMLLVHPLLFRPFAWELIGKTFLAGWPERSLRRRFQRRVTFRSYTQLLFRNLIPIVLNLGMLGIFLVVPATQPNLEILYLGLILFYWVIPMNLCRVPMILLHPHSPEAVNRAQELAAGDNTSMKLIRETVGDFVWFIGAWYISFSISFVVIASFFVRTPPDVYFLCGFLVADVLLDPLWIGFQLTLTHLLDQTRTKL